MKSMKTAWKHVRRSPYQALAAIMIMLLTFLAISTFTFLFYGSSKIITFFKSKPQVTAFFKDEAKTIEVDGLRQALIDTGKVSSIKYVSKDQALQLYKEQNKNDPLLLELVTSDILPSSLEISTYNLDDLGPISDELKTSPLVSEVIYQKDVVSSLSKWSTALTQIGLALITLLATVSIILMATIIGFKISQKREEIEIMRLLSATKWYIRWPFLLEGILYGVIGAVLGWGIASGVLIYITPFLSTFLQGIPLLPVSPILLLQLLGVELIVAVLLGTFSSFLAVLRYLK